MRFVVVTSLAFFLLGACSRHEDYQGIELRPTPITKVQSLYGVVTLATLRLRAEPSTDSDVVTVLVRGTIVEVDTVEQREVIIEGTQGRWMKLRYKGRVGWGFGGYIDIYESLESARKGVEKLGKNE